MFGERRTTTGTGLSRRSTADKTPTRPRFTDYLPNSSSVKKIVNPRFSLPHARTSIFRAPKARDVKAAQSENIRKIYEFLVEHEGDDAVPEAKIRNPMRNDFINMFEMIYQHVSPDFEIPANTRIEELVPRLFRELGYPMVIKTSTFQPIGVAHSWPVLLDALAWLIDFVQISKGVASQTQMIFLGGGATDKLLRYSWLNSAFREYTHGRDQIHTPNYSEEKAENLRRWFEQQEDTDGQLETMKSTLEQLVFDMEEIENDKGRESKLQEDLQRIIDDMRKAGQYKADIEADYEQAKKQLDKSAAEMEEIESEVERLTKVVYRKKEQIGEQAKRGVTGDRARQITLERAQDQQTLNNLEDQINQISKETWLITPNVRKAFEQQQKNLERVFTMLVEVSSGLDIASPLPRVPETESEVPKELEKAQAYLQDLRSTLASEILKVGGMRKRAEQELERIAGIMEIEKEKLEEGRRKLHREERQRRREKDEWKEARSQLEQKIDTLENEKELVEDKLQASSQIGKMVESERAALAEVQKQLADNERALQTKIADRLGPIAQHMKDMENQNLWMTVTLKGLLASECSSALD